MLLISKHGILTFFIKKWYFQKLDNFINLVKNLINKVIINHCYIDKDFFIKTFYGKKFYKTSNIFGKFFTTKDNWAIFWSQYRKFYINSLLIEQQNCIHRYKIEINNHQLSINTYYRSKGISFFCKKFAAITHFKNWFISNIEKP